MVITGGHSALGNIKVIKKLFTFKNGVYVAKIAVYDSESEEMFEKSNNSGIAYMFPESWSADRIKVEINSAYQNRKPHSISTRAKEGMWEGVTSSGVHIEGYTYPVVTAYPSKIQE